MPMLGTLIQLGEEKVLLQHMHGMASSFLDNNKEQLRVVKTSGLSGDDDDETTMDGGCDEWYASGDDDDAWVAMAKKKHC